MVKYKYNVGDRIGPWNILFLERLDITDSRKKRPYGLFECPGCKKSVKARIQNVAKGGFHWCPECRSKKRSEKWKGNNLGKNNSNNLIGKQFGSWTVLRKLDERQNGHVLWECVCVCGAIQKVTTCNLTQGTSTQCIFCGNKNYKSKGVQKIINILQNNNINYQLEKTFNNCKYKKLLRFDFYLPDYNCCIEYDGEQHFYNNGFWNNNLEENQVKDKIKDQYCKNNNIKLIRVPYWDLKKISSQYLLPLILGGDTGDVSV